MGEKGDRESERLVVEGGGAEVNDLFPFYLVF